MNTIPIIPYKIIQLAVHAHSGTNHFYDKKHPYIFHLNMAVNWGFRFCHLIPEEKRVDAISAIYLHDTIEDCRVTYGDIKDFVGQDIADLVYAVTNEKGRTRDEKASDKYYEGIRNTPYADFVKLADRLANVQYSYDTAHGMLKRYRQEHAHFVSQFNMEKKYVQEMIVELDSMLIDIEPKRATPVKPTENNG